MVDRHIRQHREMLAVANDICACASADDLSPVGALPSLRLKFARLISAHCDEEDATLRKAVADGIVSEATVDAFRRDVMLWRADLAALNSEWPPARVATDRSSFAQRFERLAAALRHHIEREDRELLRPIAARH